VTHDDNSQLGLEEGCRPAGGEDLPAGSFGGAMREREFEILGDELLDIRTTNISRLLNLRNLQDLFFFPIISRRTTNEDSSKKEEKKLTLIDRKRALCLAAKSAYMASIASVLDNSLYSLYMLCVPDLESYLNQTPKFLTFWGRFSWIWLMEITSPFAFFTLRSLARKYQKRDLAITSLGAKIRMR
jgi:hypothetical protein